MGYSETESEEIQRLAHFTIEQASDMIFWVDRQARIHRVNEAVCKTLGYSREELSLMTVHDIDTESTPETWAEFWGEFQANKIQQFECCLIAKDGHTIPAEIRVYSVESDGQFYVCAFVRDVTEQKRREFVQRFSHFTIEKAGELIYWIDSEANFKHVNQAACDLMGYTREEFLSMKTYDIDPDNPPEEFQERWQRLKKEGTLVFVGRRRTKDGRLIPLEISSNFIEFEGKEYACGFARDIRERLSTQEKLARLNRDKERNEAELNLARQIQEDFLPKVPPCYEGFCFAAKSLPARFVGGDFYDFIPLGNDRLAMVLGDVAGKGVSAALYMAQALGDFRHLVLIDPDPSAVLYAVNNILCARARQGMFATAVFLLLDMKSGRLQLANAGHHPLLLRDREGNIEKRGNASGAPLGILPDTKFAGETLELQKGDLALFYTDGATEPTDAEKTPYGLEAVAEILGGDFKSPDELIERLTDSIRAHTRHAPPQDDLTFLAIQRDAGLDS